MARSLMEEIMQVRKSMVPSQPAVSKTPRMFRKHSWRFFGAIINYESMLRMVDTNTLEYRRIEHLLTIFFKCFRRIAHVI